MKFFTFFLAAACLAASLTLTACATDGYDNGNEPGYDGAMQQPDDDRAAFDRADTNNDGVIDNDEWSAWRQSDEGRWGGGGDMDEAPMGNSDERIDHEGDDE